MRWINKINVHCSDSQYMRDDSAADIDAWHRKRGFQKIGYHFIVRLDGRIEKGREEWEVGAHCNGVLIYIAQAFMLAGALFGLDYYLDKFRNALDK